MRQITVRPIRAGDEEALRALCLETTPLRRREQSERFVVWQAYGQYYLSCEAAHCFIAEETTPACGHPSKEGNVPAAAVLCAPNYADYTRRFMERVYQKCRAYGYVATAMSRQYLLLHQKLAGRYPAHLHFLLPPARQDLAQPLFEALAAHLESLECRGVCAFPDQRKQPALYETLDALGFEFLGRSSRILLMGKELY